MSRDGATGDGAFAPVVEEYNPYDPGPSLATRITDDRAPVWYLFNMPTFLATVALAKRTPFAELEARIGTLLSTGQFQSCISEASYTALLRSFVSSPCWSSSCGPVRSVDMIKHDNSTIRKEDGMTALAIVKSDVSAFVVPDATSPSVKAKISLKTESPASLRGGSIVLVRIKTRHSFEYKNFFRYDLTKVYEGRTIEMAINSAPKFEVELECTDLQEAVRHYAGDQRFALAFAMKIEDLLARCML